jgi:hypothetical protein
MFGTWVLAGCAIAGVVFSGTAARADIYTYKLNAPTGYNGGTVTGLITVTGNAGDPVPGLNAANAFALTFTPSSGPIQTWNQSDSIQVHYNPSVDWAGGVLGDATLTAAIIPSGADDWVVTNGSAGKLTLNWLPPGYGPEWQVNNSSATTDYVYGVWSLSAKRCASTRAGGGAVGGAIDGDAAAIAAPQGVPLYFRAASGGVKSGGG